MYQLIEEQMARAQHAERTIGLELEHRQKLAMSLRPNQHQLRAQHLSR